MLGQTQDSFQASDNGEKQEKSKKSKAGKGGL